MEAAFNRCGLILLSVYLELKNKLASNLPNPVIEGRLKEISHYLSRIVKGEPCGDLKQVSSGAVGELETLLNEAILSLRLDQDTVAEERAYLERCLKEQSEKNHQDKMRLAELMGQSTEAEHSKHQFLSTMSQDIRPPMNGMLGITQILLNMPLGGSQRDYVQIIHQSNKALLSAINDLLDFSKIEAGEVSLESISFDLEMACYEVAELLQAKIREKEIELIVRFSPRLPKQFIGDPACIRQVLTNLVKNAIRYTSKGHILIEANLFQQDEGIAQIVLKVEDTGQGVDPATQEKILESFEGDSDVTIPGHSGSGFGLSICKRLVGMMGGKLTFESSLGHGSSFLFSIPLRIDKKPNSLPLDDLGGVRILVLEPNPIYTSVLRDYLAGFAMYPIIVTTTEDALIKLREASSASTAFQICLVADPLPSGDSVDFAKQVQEDSSIEDPALVVLSSENHRGDAAKFKAAGYAAYLTLPIALDSFRVTLAAALASLKVPAAAMPMITKYHIAETDTDVDQIKIQLMGHVLLADDVKVNQMVTTAMLRRLGLDVTAASTGSSAVTTWAEGRFDLVLMDCHMPEMDGLEATRRIRRIERERRVEKETPIIALAAGLLPTDRQSCLDVGMNGSLSKPFTRGKLVHVLRDFLETKQKHSSDMVLQNPDSCVDWNALKELKKIMGDQFLEMIPAFSETSEAIIGQLTITDPEDGIMIVEQLARSLSSISSGVGAVGLLSLAKMLELQAKEGRVVALPRQVSELEGAFNKARQVLESYHAQYQG